VWVYRNVSRQSETVTVSNDYFIYLLKGECTEILGGQSRKGGSYLPLKDVGIDFSGSCT